MFSQNVSVVCTLKISCALTLALPQQNWLNRLPAMHVMYRSLEFFSLCHRQQEHISSKGT